MRNLISVLIILSLAFLCCGCASDTPNDSNSISEFKIIMPTDDSINGYRTGQPNQGAGAEISEKCFYINTSTKKFHLPDCTYAKKDSSNGATVTADHDELLNNGYIPCKKCNP